MKRSGKISPNAFFGILMASLAFTCFIASELANSGLFGNHPNFAILPWAIISVVLGFTPATMLMKLRKGWRF
jgi:hypothetical protein